MSDRISPSTLKRWSGGWQATVRQELFDEAGGLRSELSAFAPQGTPGWGQPACQRGLLLRDLRLP